MFGNQGGNSTSKIRVAVVDEDGSDLSRRIVDGLKAEPALRVRIAADPEPLHQDRSAHLPIVRLGAKICKNTELVGCQPLVIEQLIADRREVGGVAAADDHSAALANSGESPSMRRRAMAA